MLPIKNDSVFRNEGNNEGYVWPSLEILKEFLCSWMIRKSSVLYLNLVSNWRQQFCTNIKDKMGFGFNATSGHFPICHSKWHLEFFYHIYCLEFWLFLLCKQRSFYSIILCPASTFCSRHMICNWYMDNHCPLEKVLDYFWV